ncbi:gp53-like domain-containing protein [Providencia sp. Je.9.19]|uniref:gp53-like domain-containing protein n=1 Tax=Providencia sp. Je.9.19 TaxID=3142844 RepID=UPI003DA98B11
MSKPTGKLIRLTAGNLGAYTKAETDTKVADAKKAGTDAQATANAANTAATNANNNANGRVPSGRKVNNKPLTADISLTAGDVGAYTKAETDTKVTDAKKAGTDAQSTANAANTAATNANNNANGRVPSGRKVNNKPLSADISLNAGDVGAYTKAEVDGKITASGGKSTANKAESGWWKCGDTGVIIQWGKGNLNNETLNIEFSIAFPNICLTVSPINTLPSAMSAINLTATSKTSATLKSRTDPATIRWMAIGY